MIAIRNNLRQLAHYPSAIIGLAIILGLILLSLYAVISIPYAEAIALWRGGEAVWAENPRNASPIWINLLPGVNRPETIVLDSREGGAEKERTVLSDETTDVVLTFTLDYTYDGFPQDVVLFLHTAYESKQPLVSLTWLTPDGREIRLGDIKAKTTDTFRVSQNERLQRRLRGQAPQQALFAQPDVEPLTPLHGTYTLQAAGLVFEDEADIDAKLVVYGDVYGLAGTDHRRRDILVALLWGTPIALAFGLLAAVGSTVTTMIIAAVGVWFGGLVDATIQRLTEVNLILPVLPILIMVGTFYSRDIWTMLGVVILLGIFSAGIKSYRAIFLQVKESPYIEAAQAYGSGNFRIVFLYMIPRIIPILVPQFVVLIPSFVFLEATLVVLGLGDPVLPTWRNVLNDARANGALYQGYYYWLLQPAFLLMLTGLGFAMVGFALDRVFNPRLRDV